MAWATTDAVPASVSLSVVNSGSGSKPNDLVFKVSPQSSGGGVFDCSGLSQVDGYSDAGPLATPPTINHTTPAVVLADATGVILKFSGTQLQAMITALGNGPLRLSLIGTQGTEQLLAYGTIAIKPVT
jgi:hypothetical protein